MRVLHIVPNFHSPSGGREIFVKGLVKHLQKYNIDQFIVTNELGNTGHQTVTVGNGKVTVFSLKLKNLGSYLGAYRMLNGLLKILKDNRYDVINIHGTGEYPADLVCILKRMGLMATPLVLTTHGISGLKHAYLAFRRSFSLTPRERITRMVHLIHDFTLGRLEMTTFDKVILLSDEERYLLSKIGLKEERIVNIPIAIDDIFFARDSHLKERRYVLFVGRMDRWKGLDTLLRAIKGLKSLGTSVSCLIVGSDGGYRSKLELLKNELEIADLVDIRDRVSQEDLVEIYLSAIVTILPSSTEGFPLVLAESMATGTPFISTPVGHIPELVNETNAGMIVPIGDAESLTKSLQHLLGHKELWDKMSANGRKYAQDYRWENIGKRYYQLYTDLIS